MKEKNNEYITLLLVIFLILLFLGIFIYVQNSKGNSAKQVDKTDNRVSETQKPESEENEQENLMQEEVSNGSVSDENEQIDALPVDEIVKTPVNGIQSESDVIQYIEEMENSVEESSEKDTSEWKVKAKKLFITVTDFIFYGGKIGNYTF